MKKPFSKILACAFAAIGFSAYAAPKVHIDTAELKTPSSGEIKYTYSITGLGEGNYDLAVEVGAKGVAKKWFYVKDVKEGTHDGTFNVTNYLDKVYPNVTLYATLLPRTGQLWENGPYWASCNVGAENPEDAGYYFWWGDTVGYRRNAANDGWVSAADGKTAHVFDAASAPTYGKGVVEVCEMGYTDETGHLLPEHDAATHYLGGPWRMPTEVELQGLADNCIATNIVIAGKNAVLVHGKGEYAAVSVVFPVTGRADGTSELGIGGNYTLSNWHYNANSARYFKAINPISIAGYNKYFGFQIRPVRSAAE